MFYIGILGVSVLYWEYTKSSHWASRLLAQFLIVSSLCSLWPHLFCNWIKATSLGSSHSFHHSSLSVLCLRTQFLTPAKCEGHFLIYPPHNGLICGHSVCVGSHNPITRSSNCHMFFLHSSSTRFSTYILIPA